jgi:2-polyprenyl-6-hydroxyphenyl methylase / 3-demethylubiquinone-9 3-methyltransferase
MNSTAQSQVDAAEIARFDAQSHAFWDREGAFRTLHDINPVRVAYIAAHAPLAAVAVADIGCGGGLLAESLAQQGATVTAIDMAGGMLDVARLHARGAGLAIDYRQQTAAELAAERPRGFPVVCCMELIEHVPDPAALMQSLGQLLQPGGWLFLSTINRTPKAFGLAILAAEYLLGLVAKGTHEYARLVRPAELAAYGRAAGLQLQQITGLAYNPLTRQCSTGGAPDVNYMALLRSSADSAG